MCVLCMYVYLYKTLANTWLKQLGLKCPLERVFRIVWREGMSSSAAAAAASCPWCFLPMFGGPGPQDAVRIFSRTYNTGDIARPHCVWEVSGASAIHPPPASSPRDRTGSARLLAC